MIGRQVWHFEILERLGEGGMGVVYRARDTQLDRDVALKFLPDDGGSVEARERFLREARAASALDHPNICTIYETGTSEDGRLFIAMACYEGQTLADLLSDGPLSIEQTLMIGIQICDGLERAHGAGIVHRDIKPANLIVTDHDEVKILDFGLAKLAGAMDLTEEGSTVGTAAYMSPEQVRGEPVDHRTDLWSLGVLLYRMSTGVEPFRGNFQPATVYSILNEEPDPPSTIRPGLPDGFDDLVADALAKDPSQRIENASRMRLRLKDCLAKGEARAAPTPGARPTSGGLRNPVVLGLLLIALLVPVIILFVANRGERAERRVALLMPELEGMVENDQFVRAWRTASKHLDELEQDSSFRALRPYIENRLTILSEPSGADVYLTPAAPRESGSSSVLVGRTPFRDMSVARDDYHVRLELDGFIPVERIASNEIEREQVVGRTVSDVEIYVELSQIDEHPADKVKVPGGTYALVGSGAPVTSSADLDSFLIDRFEVSNREYRQFVLDGGYTNRSYWKHRFVRGGESLSWSDAMRLLVDRSGLPAPRDWLDQEYPNGLDDHPVTGVTWYEAAAYAEYAGARLPTMYEWEKTARDGRIAYNWGIVMPWGLHGPVQSSVRRSNLAGTSTVPVDSFRLGISPYGAYNMAGNVKEWLLNEITGGFAVTGASWRDPIYVFSQFAGQDGFHSSDALGFRTVVGPSVENGAQGLIFVNLEERTPTYRPVDRQTYETLRRYYAYDRSPGNAVVLDSVRTDDWTRLKLAYDGPRGDRVLAYLYLPNRARPPYQCLVFIPGSSVFFGDNVSTDTEHVLGPQIKSGRAVLAVVLDGMTEREWGPDRSFPAPPSVQFRELMVQHATEIRMGMDVLDARGDIDMDALTYVGVSFGSGSRLPFAAVDDRFDAAVLIGGGIDERVKPTLPEADNVNFAPYLDVPTLMLNGRYDEEHQWYTRGLPLWNLLSEPKELVLLDAGHVPPSELRTPPINAFLDETLGPVAFE